LTRIKFVLAPVAALLLVAMGSVGAYAWVCPDKPVSISVKSYTSSTITWTVSNPNSEDVYFEFAVEQTGEHGHGTIDAGDEVSFTTRAAHGTTTLKVSVKIPETGEVCLTVKKSFTIPTHTSPPTSASPTTSTTPTHGQASPTTSTSPTSAGASPTSTASTLPSPPVTGTGAGGDGGFGAVLAALGLVILVGGGLTLFFSRGSSSPTT
jgi:hypothetical protein